MKKLISVFTLLCLALCACGFDVAAQETSADTASAEVYVTIADKGTLVVTLEKVTVTDIDSDGALTVNDALYAAHEAKCEGGAAAGYSSYMHKEYGLSLGKLWGDESGNFGYRVNDTYARGLADPVSDGDSVYAYVYKDSKTYSDQYCFFESTTLNAEAGTEVTVTLSRAAYDADWNPITLPVEGALLTLNGEATEIRTDAEGKALLNFETAGDFLLSASSDSIIMVPPVCAVAVTEPTVSEDTSSDETPSDATSSEELPSEAESSAEVSSEESTPAAGDTGLYFFTVLAVCAVCGAGILLKRS